MNFGPVMNYGPVDFGPVTDGRTDRQKAMHMSALCIGTGVLKNTDAVTVLRVKTLTVVSTLRAMTSLEGECVTFHTTPPFPAPNSPILTKSSVFSSPIFFFSVRNSCNLFLCVSSSSRSSSFCWSSSTFSPEIVLFLLK